MGNHRKLWRDCEVESVDSSEQILHELDHVRVDKACVVFPFFERKTSLH